MATRMPGKKFQAGKKMTHLFPIHHKTLKRREREDGKALEKAADRVVAKSFENSRTIRCVNLIGLFFNWVASMANQSENGWHFIYYWVASIEIPVGKWVEFSRFSVSSLVFSILPLLSSVFVRRVFWVYVWSV